VKDGGTKRHNQVGSSQKLPPLAGVVVKRLELWREKSIRLNVPVREGVMSLYRAFLPYPQALLHPPPYILHPQ
jgi:hypothetical protein